MERLADGSAAWTFPVRCSMAFSVLWSRIENLQSGAAVWSFSVLHKRIKDLDFSVPCSFGLFQSYAVEWRTCRVNLQLEFVQPCRRELKACRWLSDLDFLSVLCSIGLFWSYEIEWKLAEWSCSWDSFSPAGENKRPADGSIGCRTCRLELQFGLFQSNRRE